MIVRPDYQGGGIVNLMASLRQGMGGAGHESGDYAAAGALDPAEIDPRTLGSYMTGAALQAAGGHE